MKKKLQVLFLMFGLGISPLSNIIAQTPLPSGLIAYYPFDGNANDVSGNNLNGIVTGASLTTNRNNLINSAYDFDFINAHFGQQNDEIYIPYGNKLNVSNITVSVWLYPREYYWNVNASDPNSTIINRYQYTYSTPSGGAWGLSFNESSVTGAIFSEVNGFVVSNQPLQLNIWHHIVMTYDGMQIKLFIDGNLSATQEYSKAMNILSISGISIGESNIANGFWNHTNGKIDDIGIWNRALTVNEIQQLYSGSANNNIKVVIQNNAKSILITPDQIQTSSTVTGASNTFIGENALKNNRDGDNNTAIGYQAGAITSGTGNIFLGANAGNMVDFENASNKLIIANSNTTTPLIYGELDNNILKINGKLILQKNNGIPETSTSSGLQGQIAFDDDYLYICVQNNVWKRLPLNNW